MKSNGIVSPREMSVHACVHRVAACQGDGAVGQRRRDAGPTGGSGPYWRAGSIPGPPEVSGGVGLAILAREAA